MASVHVHHTRNSLHAAHDTSSHLLLSAAPQSPAPQFASSQAPSRDAHSPCARRGDADAPPCGRHRRPCLGRPRRPKPSAARHAHAPTPNVHLEPRRIIRVEAQRQATRGAPPVGRWRRAAAATARRGAAAAARRRRRAGSVGTAPDARGHVPTSRRLQENREQKSVKQRGYGESGVGWSRHESGSRAQLGGTPRNGGAGESEPARTYTQTKFLTGTE